MMLKGLHYENKKLKKRNVFLRRLIFLFFILIFFNARELYSEFIMPISADLNYYNLNVGYEFSGDYITLFGTKENLENIAIMIKGPERNYLINKREKFFHLWIKRTTKIFDNTPSYHATWISEGLYKERDLMNFYDIELDSIFSQDIRDDFSEYFLKDMRENKALYMKPEIIESANNNLFKVNLFLPNNATIGNYLVNVLSFDNKNNVDGKIVMTFRIMHSDFNNFIYRMNKETPKLYVLFLIIFAFLTVGIIRYFY
jgi:hypothetical protein